jgi:hypothetical protein
MNFFSDENLAKFEPAVEQIMNERCTLTLSEFVYFRPLYQKRSPYISADEYKRLSEEFMARISMFHPLKIVADFPDEKGVKPLLFTLPPIFSRVEQLKTQHHDFPTRMANVINRLANNPFTPDIMRATDLMLAAISAANDSSSPEYKARLAEYTEIMRQWDPMAAQPPKTDSAETPKAQAPKSTLLGDDGWEDV